MNNNQYQYTPPNQANQNPNMQYQYPTPQVGGYNQPTTGFNQPPPGGINPMPPGYYPPTPYQNQPPPPGYNQPMYGQPGFQPQQNQMQQVRFIVHAWDLFFNFPVDVLVYPNEFVENLVRQACEKAQVSYNNVMGLKIKPKQTKKALQKAEFLPPNLLVSQVLQNHHQGNESLHLHLDLMPMIGMQLTKKPRLVFLPYNNLQEIQKEQRHIGESIVALANNEGGQIIIGIDQNLRIRGTNVEGMKNQQLQKFFTDIFNHHIQPLTYQNNIKTKVHPVTGPQSQPTNLSGIIIEVKKWNQPSDLYSYDNVFCIMKKDHQVTKLASHELVQIFKERKNGKKNKK